MNQEDKKKQLAVTLFVEEEVDYLQFDIEKHIHKLNLNLEDNQADIKRMFCDLIPLLEENAVELALGVDEKYDNTLMREVATSYVQDLNNELDSVRTEILDEKSEDEEEW